VIFKKRIKKFLTHKLNKPREINFRGYKFMIFLKVFNPQPAISSKILSDNIKIKKGAKVLDMGCGTGIQGILFFYKGAGKITFADNNPHAIKNTKENLKIHSLCKNVEVIKSNLFQNIKGKFDTILFNSPFIYTKKPIKKDWIAKSIFDYKYQKIRKFFRDSKKTFKY
jgi:methylase of polypeptide subunit release factors